MISSTPQIGVKALLNDRAGNYLFLERATPLPSGDGIRWDIPGGRLRPGEQLRQGLGREILEETGLTLEASPELLAAQDIIVEDTGLHVVRLTYRAPLEGTIILSSEHKRAQRASTAEALELNLDPYLRAVLENL